MVERHAVPDGILEEALARSRDEPGAYISDLRDLQYREPAAVDVHLMTYPDSTQVTAQWNAGRAGGIALVNQAHQAGALRADFTADDLYSALVANALALRHQPKPKREDYDRRGRFLLDSLRPRP